MPLALAVRMKFWPITSIIEPRIRREMRAACGRVRTMMGRTRNRTEASPQPPTGSETQNEETHCYGNPQDRDCRQQTTESIAKHGCVEAPPGKSGQGLFLSIIV